MNIELVVVIVVFGPDHSYSVFAISGSRGGERGPRPTSAVPTEAGA